MPRRAIGPAGLRWVLGHRALFRVVKFAMAKFPARTPCAQQLPDAVKREVRFLAQALDGIDPSVVEVRIVLDPVVGLERDEKAFAHVVLDLRGRNVAAAGGNVDGDAFRRGVWKRSLDGVAHSGHPVLLLPTCRLPLSELSRQNEAYLRPYCHHVTPRDGLAMMLVTD